MDEQGQVSVELLIVIAVLAALAIFLADQMTSASEKMGQRFENKVNELDNILKNVEP